MFRSKRFRASLSFLLAILTLIHTTPLYASEKRAATPKASSSSGKSASTQKSNTTTNSTGGASEQIPTTTGLIASGQAPGTMLSTGAATYSIPIEVPPGRGNIAPNLSLTYNSYSGNSWVGVGWNLDMGAIQRSTKHGLDYGKADYVAVVQNSISEIVPRPDWGSGLYSNKIEGVFLKYHLTSGNAWEVTDKSGTIYYYGTNEDSRQQTDNTHIFKWYLDKVKDVNGNYMTVSYQKDQGQLYITSIDYTGNQTTGLGTSNRVTFELDTVVRTGTDAPISYASHFPVRTTKRLKSISVYGKNEFARKYVLGYTSSPTSSRSLLQSVTLFGDDLTPAPPVMFQYQTSSLGLQPKRSMGTRGTPETLPTRSQILDVNSDGLADFVYYAVTSSVLGQITGQFRIRRDSSPSYQYPSDDVWGTMTPNTHFSSEYTTFYLADLIGDSYPDVIYDDTEGNIHVLMNTGDSLLGEDNVLGVRAPGSLYNSTLRIADVNRDGVLDLIYEAGNQIKVLKGNAANGAFTAFSPEQNWGVRNTEYLFAIDANKFKTADVNGDGLPDVVYDGADGQIHVLINTGTSFGQDTPWLKAVDRVMPNVQCGAFPGPPYLFMADVNGDGLEDAIYTPCDPATGIYEIRVALSTGTGFLPDVSWGTINASPNPVPYNVPTILDVNGDGLPDLVYHSNFNDNQPNGTGYIQVFLNIGSAFWYAGVWWTYTGNSYEGFSMADINGDGLPDFVFENFVSGSAPTTYTFSGNGPAPDLVHRIDNGLGGWYEIEYKSSSTYSNKYLPYPVQTVSQITAHDGIANANTTSYTYSGGLHDILDKEFRGFSYVKQTLPNGTTVESYFLQEDITKGLVYDQITKGLKQDGTVAKFNRLINTYNTTIVYNGIDPEHTCNFPWLWATDQYIYDGYDTPKHISTELSYDIYGNIQSKFQQGDVAVTGDEHYEYTKYAYDTAKWLLARPWHVITSSSPTSATLSMTTFDYYSGSNLVKTKTFWLDDPPGNDPVIQYGYDTCGNLESQTDARGYPTVTQYDETKTFPQTVTNALGQEITTTYNKWGKLHTKTDLHYQGDLNPTTTTYDYDAFGRPSKVVGPYDTDDYPALSYSYVLDASGLLTVSVQAKKEYLTIEVCSKATSYDGFGREIATQSDGPDGNTIHVETVYNEIGKLWRKSLPHFSTELVRWAESKYDCLGRLVESTTPDQRKSTISYDRGRTSYIDPRGKQRDEDRDAYSRLVTVWQWNNGICWATNYHYDALGRLRDILDAHGDLTEIGYDSLSRKINMTDPNMGHWKYEYDANGNLLYQTDAKLQTISYQYDPVNRPWLKSYPSGTPVEYFYDEPDSVYGNTVGRMTRVTDASGETKQHYDKLGRVVLMEKTVNDIDGEDAATYSIGYSYDAMNSVTSIQYPDNDDPVNYAYDCAGNITGVSGYLDISGYNALGQPGIISFHNGVLTSLQYYNETDNRLKSIATAGGSEPLQALGYTYDNNADILSITDGVEPPGNPPVMYPGSSLGSYTYDPNHPHAVKTAGANSYDYDANGNMTRKNAMTLEYDYDNRLKRAVNDSSTTEFIYDYKGMRVVKDSLSSKTIYIGNLVEIKDGEYTKLIFAGGRRIASKSNSGTYYYHPDHLGGLNVVTNNMGENVQTVLYHPFGEQRVNTGQEILAYKFTGQPLDLETGFYYYGARYYDPDIGRFITPDTIVQAPADPQTLNRYAYCRNNPSIYTDPSGHNFLMFLFLAGLVVGTIQAAVASHGSLQDFGVGLGIVGLSAIIGYATGAMANSIISTSVIGDAVARGAAIGAIAGMTAGAAEGAMSAAYYGGNIGRSALMGAGMGGLSGAAMGALEGYMSAGNASNGDNLHDTDGHQITGEATCYDLQGKQRADRKDFDPEARSAAMYGKGTYKKEVNIFRIDKNGEVLSQALGVKIDDTGPFLRGSNGRAVWPLQPDPKIVIDVTPRIYQELTGYRNCLEGPGNFRVRVEW